EAASSTTNSQPGVKPSNSTTHWTHCTTGGSGTGSATCTAQAGTPNVNTDVSKRYGNGKTAAQIAVGHGAPDGTLITGPGNSQPHKVSACGKPSNRSGGVDVHAIKSYDAAACRPQPTQPVVPVTQTHTPSACGEQTVVTESTQIVGGLHGRNEHLMTNPKSAHFTKHDDEDAVATSNGTKVVSTGD